MPGYYIIDAYNVMHRIPRVRIQMSIDLEHARRLLIQMVSSRCCTYQERALLVFDGITSSGRSLSNNPRVQVCFSGNGEKADPLIKRLVDDLPRPREAKVVTSDREIRSYVRQYGCQVLSAKNYINLLSPECQQPETTEEKPKMNADELKEWLRLFEQRKPPV